MPIKTLVSTYPPPLPLRPSLLNTMVARHRQAVRLGAYAHASSESPLLALCDCSVYHVGIGGIPIHHTCFV